MNWRSRKGTVSEYEANKHRLFEVDLPCALHRGVPQKRGYDRLIA